MADIEHLKLVILVVSDYCKDKLFFGAIHLNKILYYSDFLHYRLTGKPITGAEYFKLERGPAPRHLLPAREALIAEGKLLIREVAFSEKSIQKRAEPIGKVDDSFLTELQRRLLHSVADEACKMPAGALSESTHVHLGWVLAENNQIIPYNTVHCTKVNPVTKSGLEWALALARKKIRAVA